MGGLVLATASLVPPPAEAASVNDAGRRDGQHRAVSDRVRQIREQMQTEATSGPERADPQGKDLLAWGNWGNWHNWHNWRSWHN
jgi:hypothetical protein